MNAPKAEYSKARGNGRCLIGIAGAALLAASALGAEDLPSFQPGLWSFTINIVTPGSSTPHVQMVTSCTNPSDEIRKKWQSLAVKTCQFSPIAHAGNRYSYSSTCQKDGMRLSMQAVITVQSEQAYRVDTESKTNNQVRKESLVAKREGDCKKPDGRMPVPQPRKDPEHQT